MKAIFALILGAVAGVITYKFLLDSMDIGLIKIGLSILGGIVGFGIGCMDQEELDDLNMRTKGTPEQRALYNQLKRNNKNK